MDNAMSDTETKLREALEAVLEDYQYCEAFGDLGARWKRNMKEAQKALRAAGSTWTPAPPFPAKRTRRKTKPA